MAVLKYDRLSYYEGILQLPNCKKTGNVRSHLLKEIQNNIKQVCISIHSCCFKIYLFTSMVTHM